MNLAHGCSITVTEGNETFFLHFKHYQLMANSMYLKHHISAIKFWNENYITGLLTLLLLTLITRNRQPFSAPPRFRSPSTCPPPQVYMLKKL